MPPRTRRLVVLMAALAAPAAGADAVRFVREGVEVRRIDVTELVRACHAQTIELDDPNYGGRKRYRACPLAEILTIGFGTPPRSLAGADVFIRAWDGYDKPATADELAQDGAWLAFGDADLSSGTALKWAPLGPRHIDPGPLYLVWTLPAARDLSRYSWPWQIAEFEVIDFRKKYPHVIPDGVPRDAPAWHGFELFRGECIACHAINREGGTVGPDLNVPRSIVEYRPVEQIKAYIRDPATFRYGNMPAHRDLTDGDLDALVAYFRAMSERKHDPGAK